MEMGRREKERKEVALGWDLDLEVDWYCVICISGEPTNGQLRRTDRASNQPT